MDFSCYLQAHVQLTAVDPAMGQQPSRAQAIFSQLVGHGEDMRIALRQCLAISTSGACMNQPSATDIYGLNVVLPLVWSTNIAMPQEGCSSTSLAAVKSGARETLCICRLVLSSAQSGCCAGPAATVGRSQGTGRTSPEAADTGLLQHGHRLRGAPAAGTVGAPAFQAASSW